MKLLFSMKWLIAAGLLFMQVANAQQAGVLVFGGTGRLGAPIVELLLEAGESVTVFTRPGSNRDRLQGMDVSYAVGDLLNKEQVSAVLAGGEFRVLIDASARRGTEDLFYDKAMDNIVAAASDRGVQQIIYHSSIGAGDNMQDFPRASWGRMRDVLLAKGEAEQTLARSGIGYTVIRNGLLQPSGTPATGQARLAEDQTLMSIVTRADLALLTMECLDNDDCLGKIYHAVDDSFDVPEAFR